MVPRIKSFYDFHVEDYMVVPEGESMTQPDLNADIKTLLRSYTRDSRSMEFIDDDDFETDLLPGQNCPYVDKLTETEELSDELNSLSESLSKAG